jgi:hypothetical protein
MCPPFIAGNQKKCLTLSGTVKLFNRMTGCRRDSFYGTEKLFNHKTEIGKISSLYALVFSDSVCTTIKSDLGEELWSLTPPWEALGLSDSLGNFFFNLSNYSTHHALSTLADQPVQEGMLLDAATAIEDDRLRDEAADQKHPAADHVKLD